MTDNTINADENAMNEEELEDTDILYIEVPADIQGQRLDLFLANSFSQFSRSRLKAFIEAGQVFRDGQAILEARYKVRSSEIYQIQIPEAEPAIPQPEDIPLTIVYEDEALIVIDKQAGLVVHPGAGNWTGTLVNALLHHCGASLSGIGGVKRPGIVHRIDKETSGLMVVAKTDQAHHHLSEQFAAHGRDGRMTRAYTAFVWGKPERMSGLIEAPLARKDNNRLKMAVVRQGGKHAITHYQVMDMFYDEKGCPAVSEICCELETGRTHQIRVHMAHIGHPLLGDPVYGMGFSASKNKLSDEARHQLDHLKRQALHASHLGFEHPLTGEHLAFDSPLPQDLEELKAALNT